MYENVQHTHTDMQPSAQQTVYPSRTSFQVFVLVIGLFCLKFLFVEHHTSSALSAWDRILHIIALWNLTVSLVLLNDGDIVCDDVAHSILQCFFCVYGQCQNCAKISVFFRSPTGKWWSSIQYWPEFVPQSIYIYIQPMIHKLWQGKVSNSSKVGNQRLGTSLEMLCHSKVFRKLSTNRMAFFQWNGPIPSTKAQSWAYQNPCCSWLENFPSNGCMNRLSIALEFATLSNESPTDSFSEQHKRYVCIEFSEAIDLLNLFKIRRFVNGIINNVSLPNFELYSPTTCKNQIEKWEKKLCENQISEEQHQTKHRQNVE